MTTGKETQPQTEIYSPEEFLEKLYDRILDWLKSRESQVHTVLEPQEIRGWQPATAMPGGHPSFPLKLEKGVLLRDSKKDFALSLGRGLRTPYRGQTLRLQFGFVPRSRHRENLTIEDYKVFMFRWGVAKHYGCGEFYVDTDFNAVDIDCWADNRQYGGQEVSRWPKEKRQSVTGLAACLEIVQRTVRNAYAGISSPGDLT